jgi:hypothetical protein
VRERAERDSGFCSIARQTPVFFTDEYARVENKQEMYAHQQQQTHPSLYEQLEALPDDNLPRDPAQMHQGIS